jgi:putative transcriptional regulator
LTLNTSTKLRAEELYLIALAVDVEPAEILKEIYGHLKLINDMPLVGKQRPSK